ncbi:MAG: hypothetical protein C0498_05745 [Anaerolinea sp.]|nr:hypothetical protein [Anaerolinea sp.]
MESTRTDRGMAKSGRSVACDATTRHHGTRGCALVASGATRGRRLARDARNQRTAGSRSGSARAGPQGTSQGGHAMCFDADSRPPIPPIAGGALDAGLVTLTSEDGTEFTAFRAVAARPTGAGILILPDVHGLHAYYEELALRFAEHGIDALAIDYFARTAEQGRRGPDFDYAPHVPQTTWQTLAADIRTGVAMLRSPSWADGRAPASLFTTGFCMGGRLTFLSGTLGLGLAGLIGFYGWPTGLSRNGTPAPADLASAIASPILAIWGGADQGIPASTVAEFEMALDGAGVEHRSISARPRRAPSGQRLARFQATTISTTNTTIGSHSPGRSDCRLPKTAWMAAPNARTPAPKSPTMPSAMVRRRSPAASTDPVSEVRQPIDPEGPPFRSETASREPFGPRRQPIDPEGPPFRARRSLSRRRCAAPRPRPGPAGPCPPRPRGMPPRSARRRPRCP